MSGLQACPITASSLCGPVSLGCCDQNTTREIDWSEERGNRVPFQVPAPVWVKLRQALGQPVTSHPQSRAEENQCIRASCFLSLLLALGYLSPLSHASGPGTVQLVYDPMAAEG